MCAFPRRERNMVSPRARFWGWAKLLAGAETGPEAAEIMVQTDRV